MYLSITPLIHFIMHIQDCIDHFSTKEIAIEHRSPEGESCTKFNKYYIIKKLADIIICMGHCSTKEISVYRAAFRTFPQRVECK